MYNIYEKHIIIRNQKQRPIVCFFESKKSQIAKTGKSAFCIYKSFNMDTTNQYSVL